MDYSGDDFYDDEVTSGPIDESFGEDTIFDTFGDEADPFGGEDAGLESSLFGDEA